MQKKYVNEVQNKPEEFLDLQDGLFSEAKDDFQEIAKVRDEGINNLISNINELASIFKELSTLVLDQGTILDRIDYNLLMTKDNMEKAVVQLHKAEQHQSCTRATSCLLFLMTLTVLLLLLLIFKTT